MISFDLDQQSVRELNQALHNLAEADTKKKAEKKAEKKTSKFEVLNARGAHALACGIDSDVNVVIKDHVGYYCAGMHQRGSVIVEGNAGVGLAENMMSGVVRVKGNASQAAGATAHGGLLVVEGDAAARCGISLKGADIVVQGSVGHMSCFMAQAGTLVVCGDAGDNLGDSLYETEIYVQGEVKSLGMGCVEKPLRAEHHEALGALLNQAGIDANPAGFKRYGSDRSLYNFHTDNAEL